MKSTKYLNELRKNETENTKICSTCEQLLPLDRFSNNKKSRRGKRSECKKCVQQNRINKKITNKENVEKYSYIKSKREQEPENMKYCPKCDRYFELNGFHKTKRGRKGVMGSCKECRTKYWDKVNNISKEYRDELEKTKKAIEQEPENMKKCIECQSILPLENFSKSKQDRKGRHGKCKNCLKHYRLKYKYSLTQEDYKRLTEEQDHKCKICNKKVVDLVVDHCHTSGEVRGLLCKHCNNMLGFAKDNPETLANAIKYLKAQ